MTFSELKSMKLKTVDAVVHVVRAFQDPSVPHPSGVLQAPHVSLIVQARGMLDPTYTRVYFADEEEANAVDPVLTSVPAERRGTLIALRVDDGAIAVYRFDIRYQGEDETVFFDV